LPQVPADSPAIDQTLEAELPDCGGELEETKIDKQYQTEIPQSKIERIEFHIHVGRCKWCGERVQGRHPRQSSEAGGCAASQLGPRAVALATELNKGLGLSYGETAALLNTVFGLPVSWGGLAQALERVARKAELTYQESVGKIRESPSVTPDETGRKVDGKLWWMWAFSSDLLTVYSIQPGRGYEQAAAILGANFDGFLVRDGWAVYRRFTQAVHQTCLAHLLRRCCEMLEVATPGEVKFSLAMKEILQDSLKLRDRRDLNQIGEHELAIACEQLEDRLDALSNATIALLLIGACPTTWCGNAMPSSRFSTAAAWMQPTTVQSRPIGLW
jgi:transposase